MDEKEIEELREIIGAYKSKKVNIYDQIAELDKLAWEGKKFPWHVEDLKNDLYRELTNSDERKAFSEQSKRTKDDPEFEKHFRSIFLDYFLGIKISPEHL